MTDFEALRREVDDSWLHLQRDDRPGELVLSGRGDTDGHRSLRWNGTRYVDPSESA